MTTTLTKEEQDLIKEYRQQQAKAEVFNGNQPLIDELNACKREVNDKGNQSFDPIKLARFFEMVLGMSPNTLKTVQGTIYEENVKA
jgi:hypothetical protein